MHISTIFIHVNLTAAFLMMFYAVITMTLTLSIKVEGQG